MNGERRKAEPRRPRLTIEQAEGGEWITPPVSYVDPVRRFCAMTGRPIARKYWRVIVGDQELAFAGREEALLCATYPTSLLGMSEGLD